MKYNFLKNKNSTAKILGISIISLFVMMTALTATVFISPAIGAEDNEDLYEEEYLGAEYTIDPNPILEESCGIDIMLVLDSSGSMSSTDIATVKNAANGMVDALLPGTEARIGVVEFDSDVVPTTLSLSTDPTTIKNRINLISDGGNTNWAAAITEADSELGTGMDPAENDTLIIMITDGQPNRPSGSALSSAVTAANTAKSHGTRIVAIGIHSNGNNGGYNLDNLKAISGPANVTVPPDTITKDTDVIDGETEQLESILYDLITSLCQDCGYICFTPNALNDDIDEIPDNDDLQDMLDSYNAETATIDVLNDQTQAQQFDIDDDVTSLSFEFEFVGKEAGHDNVFGYYFDEDIDNFTAIFETTDHWLYNAPLVEIGDTITVTDIMVGDHDSISFAIDSNSSNGNYPYYMHNHLNYQNYDRALAFKHCDDITDQYDTFIVCFEDLPDVNNPQGSDEDYEDVVTIVRILECPSCEEEPPEMVPIPDDICLESAPTVQITITDNYNLNNIYYQIDDYTGTWILLAENIDGQLFDEPWTLPGFEALSEGWHTVYFKADDDCENTGGGDGSWFYNFQKDTLSPYTESIEFLESKRVTNTSYGGSTYEMISCNDEMFITIADNGSDVVAAYYSIWWNNIPTDYEIIEPSPSQRWVEVLDGGPNDHDNEQDGTIVLNISFDRDCFHEIQWYAIDDCGHVMLQADYILAVDCSPPDISKDIIPEIFQDNIYGAWSWINSSSQIIINVTDEGCNGGAGVCTMSYVIKKSINPVPIPGTNQWIIVKEDTIGDDSTGDEWDTLAGVIQNITTMDEDCLHEIEIWAEDCVGNSAYMKQRHLVDNTPPNITKTVNMPYCEQEQDAYGHDVWCVNLSTLIEFEIEEEGCVGGIGLETVYYRVWDQVNKWSEPTYLTIENDYASGKYQFQEECKHYLEIVAIDKLGNTNVDNETFFVDESAPGVDIEFGTPNCIIIDYEKEDGSEGYCINFSTPIMLSAWERGCCDDLVLVNYTVINDDTGLIIDEGDLEIVDEEAAYTYYFTEECNHTIILYAEDCLGNSNTTSMSFHVDESEPGVDISVGDPNCMKDEGVYCVNFTTPINLSAWERGCCDDLVLVNYTVINDDTDTIIEEGELTIVDEEAAYTYYFTEECNHTIILYAIDCLGNENTTMMHFKVDKSEPTIEVEVDGDICIPDDGFDYCVNMRTSINIYVSEQGCCDELENASYRIKYEDEPWGPWTSLTFETNGHSGNAYATVHFKEECNHTLQIQAWDCLENKNFTEMTFHVDESEPGVKIEVGTPNCEPINYEQGYQTYCVNFSTPIMLSAWERGCCDDLVLVNYTVINDDTDTIIEEGELTIVDEEAAYTYYFTEECNHTIILYAVDCLGNENTTMMHFKVDEQEPTIEIDPVGDICIPDDGFDYCVTTETIIYIYVFEQGCCNDLENASYRIKYEDEAWGPWKSLYFPGETDGYAYDKIHFEEECNHTLQIQAWDCLENKNFTEMTFHVDDSEPSLDVTVGMDNCQIDDDEYCIRTDTPIDIVIEEQGCCNDLVNASYRIWNESDGWSKWFDIYQEEQPIMKTITIDEECNHYLEVQTWDCLMNKNSTNMSLHVDDSEPSLEVEVKDPSCEPEDGYDYCIRTDTPIDIIIKDIGCCEDLVNASYRIGNESGWGPWKDLLPLLDEQFREIETTINIPEECNHTLQVQAWDCLENKNFTEMTFHVDDQAPMINKTVGLPKIPIDGDDDPGYEKTREEIDYWVNCTTLITIDVEDQGCCDQLFNVSYSINKGPWISIIDQLPFSFDFDESCMHTLDIVAKDCLGNTMYHNETFKVDCVPPESEKTFWGPSYPEDLNDNGIIDNDDERYYWLQDHGTHIILHASENYTDEIICDVGIDYLYVELWWDQDENGTIDADEMHPDPKWPMIIKDNYDENDSNTCEGYIEYNFTINEDCLHELRWYAVDKLGNKEAMHVQQHRVDSQPPETVKTFNGPTCEANESDIEKFGLQTDDEIMNFWLKTNETEIVLTTADLQEPCAVGLEKVHIELWWDSNGDDIIDTMLWSENLTEQEEGAVQYSFFIEEDCLHQIRWYSIDKLGNTEDEHRQYHRADSQPPVITKTVGNPSIEDPDDPGTWWITMYTPINITAVDQKSPCAVGGVIIEYNIEYPAGEWTGWQLYTKNITFDEGCVHNLSIRATDCLGNRAYHNETFIVHGPSGDTNPDVEIEYPRNSVFPGEVNQYCEDTLEVIINASDGQTPSEELDVILWIQGGRHEAPTLWYETTYLGDDLFGASIDIYKYKNGAQLTLWAAALDEDSNLEFALPVTFEVCSDTCYDWWLEKGWSSLSLPIDILQCAGFCSTEVEDVLASVDGMYDWVARYDSSGYWDLYHVGYDDELMYADGVLSEILTGETYWINMTQAGRFYTDGNPPSVSINNPIDESIIEDLDEINGTAYDLETGIASVHLNIYSESTEQYWNGSTWVSDETWLECNGQKLWSYDTTMINWECGEYVITAKATDNAGCSTMHSVSLTFECPDDDENPDPR